MNDNMYKDNLTDIRQELIHEEKIIINKFMNTHLEPSIKNVDKKLSDFYHYLSLRLSANHAMQDLCRCAQAKGINSNEIALSTYNYYASAVYLFFESAIQYGNLKECNIIKNIEGLEKIHSEIFHPGEIEICSDNNTDVEIRTGSDFYTNINNHYTEETLLYRINQVRKNYTNTIKL
ncbi:hypothetical protein [Eubacterium sp. F2]|uniref:hypothetical protein n=1 Tax=Eubacterium sp. F2 TaxID=3381348 RepID=UPI0039082A6B